jgi:lysophospholipase L1-like esterase
LNFNRYCVAACFAVFAVVATISAKEPGASKTTSSLRTRLFRKRIHIMERIAASAVVAFTVAFSACLFKTAAAAPVQIMCLGDSITEGTAPPIREYRDQLYRKLAGANVDFTLVGSSDSNSSALLTGVGQAHHEGHGGYTIQNIYDNLDANVYVAARNNYGGRWLTRSGCDPNIILLHIGSNNIGQGEGAAEMARLLDGLMGKIFALEPNTALLVASLIPSRDADKESTITEFNALIPSLVEEYADGGRKCYFVDMHGELNVATDIAGDGTHPTRGGFDKIGDAWFSALRTNGLVVPEPSSLSMLFALRMTLLVLAWRRHDPH